MRQVLRAGALGRPRGMGWGGRREGWSGWGTHVYPWLIHVNVWQNPLQYCKVVSLQLIKINRKKIKFIYFSHICYKQQWETRLHLQHFARKSPQLIIQAYCLSSTFHSTAENNSAKIFATLQKNIYFGVWPRWIQCIIQWINSYKCTVSHDCIRKKYIIWTQQFKKVSSNLCPLNQRHYPAISSSVIPFSSWPQSFPASGSFPKDRLFTSGGQSTGASASTSVSLMNIQGWFPLRLTGLTSLQSKGLSIFFSSTTVQNHQLCRAQASLWSFSHIHTWLLEKQ